MAQKRTKMETNVNPFVGQYSRQSFDRFGDDLCEVLLSYLSFEDKIRLQCVDKQWNRFILTKQSVLIVSTRSECKDNVRQLNPMIVNSNRLKSLLKKCPYI